MEAQADRRGDAAGGRGNARRAGSAGAAGGDFRGALPSGASGRDELAADCVAIRSAGKGAAIAGGVAESCGGGSDGRGAASRIGVDGGTGRRKRSGKLSLAARGARGYASTSGKVLRGRAGV